MRKTDRPSLAPAGWRLRPARLIAIAAALVGLSGCNVLTSDYAGRLDTQQGGFAAAPFSCNSTAGYYNLPKTMFSASITYTKAGAELTGPEFNGITLSPVADPDHRYCLSFASGAAADETLRVHKTQTDLLSVVTANTLDQSRFILQTFLQTIFVAISGSVTASVRGLLVASDRTEIKYINTFDPFDYADTARFNDRAKDFGYCVFIPGYAFDPTKMTIQQYCDDPDWGLKKYYPQWKRQAEAGQLATLHHARTAPVVPRVTDPDHLEGVLYRPKFPYPVYLMEKQGKTWEVRERRVVMLENIAPILSVQVRRGALAQRTTAFRFRNGVLEDACIYNGAGATQFVEIPLSIARAIIRLPAEIISVQIGETAGDIELARVEQRILLAQQRQLELLADPDADLSNAPGGGGNVNFVPAITEANRTAANATLATGRAATDDFVTAATGEIKPAPACPALDTPPVLGLPLTELAPPSGFKETGDATRRPFIPN